MSVLDLDEIKYLSEVKKLVRIKARNQDPVCLGYNPLYFPLCFAASSASFF